MRSHSSQPSDCLGQDRMRWTRKRRRSRRRKISLSLRADGCHSSSEGAGGTRGEGHLGANRETDRRCICAAEEGAVGRMAKDCVSRQNPAGGAGLHASKFERERRGGVFLVSQEDVQRQRIEKVTLSSQREVGLAQSGIVGVALLSAS